MDIEVLACIADIEVIAYIVNIEVIRFVIVKCLVFTFSEWTVAFAPALAGDLSDVVFPRTLVLSRPSSGSHCSQSVQAQATSLHVVT